MADHPMLGRLVLSFAITLSAYQALAIKWLPVITCASVAAIGLMPSSASAFQTVVGGKTYEFSTFFGSYKSNTGKFTTAEMPWFGSEGLARDFASAVGKQLGVGLIGQGPLFAYSTLSVFGTVVSTKNAINVLGLTISPLPILSGAGNNYAVAQEVVPPPGPPTESVPGPLPLMGVGVAFGFSRRLRSRIQRSTSL